MKSQNKNRVILEAAGSKSQSQSRAKIYRERLKTGEQKEEINIKTINIDVSPKEKAKDWTESCRKGEEQIKTNRKQGDNKIADKRAHLDASFISKVPGLDGQRTPQYQVPTKKYLKNTNLSLSMRLVFERLMLPMLT